MTQHRLNIANVRTAFEHQSRHRVPKEMASPGLADGCRSDVGVELGNYDPTKPLVIDPILDFSSYLGGSGDEDSKAVHQFIEGSSATPEVFLNDLAKPLSAIGYVGHSFDIFPVPPARPFSIGLSFTVDNSALFRAPSPTDNPPYTINAPGIRQVPVAQIKTQSKVVFIGSCYSGPVFQSLWNIQPQTVGQALIVPQNPSAIVYLGHAYLAWQNILDDLVNKHMNVNDAVTQTNNYLPTLPPDTNGNPIGDSDEADQHSALMPISVPG